MSAIRFSVKAKTEFDSILEKHKDKKSALMAVLYLAQREFGELNPEVETYVGELLNLMPAHVHGVATFYTMFHTEKVGKYLLQLCRTLSCELRGEPGILKFIEQKLGITNGQTTRDGKFSLMLVECLGYCGTAPVIQVNDQTYENLTREKVSEILGGLP
jgi:NADH-quinone oxidoreductase subunit E